MKPCIEPGIRAKRLDCRFERAAVHHQAGRRHDAFAMGLCDRFIDSSRKTQIVRGDDQFFKPVGAYRL